MKMKRIIAALLSVVMLCGSFTFLMPVSAAEESTEEFANPAFLDYSSATTEAIERRVYNSAQEYLDSFMQLRVTSGAFQLYTNHFTGEVALKNRLTGQILSTNPFAFGETEASSTESTTNWWAGEEIREQLLSQVLISYKDQTGAMKTMDSFSEAAQRGQIVMQDIKNGVRVEYVIGRLDTTYLLPMWIMDDRFEEEIVMPICERLDELLMSYGETELYDEESGETREEFYDRAIEPLDQVWDFICRHELFSLCDLYNVNVVPDAKGTRITRQGGHFYSDDFVHQGNNLYLPQGKCVYQNMNDLTLDTDCVMNGYNSIMPLTINRADVAVYEKIKDLSE